MAAMTMIYNFDRFLGAKVSGGTGPKMLLVHKGDLCPAVNEHRLSMMMMILFSLVSKQKKPRCIRLV